MRPFSAEASRGKSHLPSLNLKGSFTPLLPLKKFPDITVSTREEHRGTRQHQEEPRFSLVARSEGSFPRFVEKRFPAFPSHLKRRRSPQKRREELQGSCHHSQSPPNVSVHTRGTCFTCTASTCMPSIDSHYGGMSHRPVGKSPWKASRESYRSLCQGNRKPDTASPAREENGRACSHLKRGLTPLWSLQKYPEVHVSTGEETSGYSLDSTRGLRPGTVCRGIPRGPSQLAWRLQLSEATRAGP